MKATSPELLAEAVRLRVTQRMSLGQIADRLQLGRSIVGRAVRAHPLTEAEKRSVWSLQVKGRKRCADGRLASGPDLSGRQFGKLTALRRQYTDGNHPLWECACACGNTHVVRTDCLVRGTTLSCGCHARELSIARNTKPAAGVLFARFFRAYIAGAAERGLAFELSKEQCVRMYRSPCHYCGAVAISATDKKRCRFNGIDRRDSAAGYVAGNCVPCCSRCNYAKRSESEANFIAWAVRVADHQRWVGAGRPSSLDKGEAMIDYTQVTR